MNRMRKKFEEMSKKGEKIFVAYYPLCDPLLENQVEWAGKYFSNGVTVLEMGLPYENPVLDGQIVRESMERALKKSNLEDAFLVMKSIREKYPENILQIMTYYENIESVGVEDFAKKCDETGVDAVLAPNASKLQLQALNRALNEYDIINLQFVPFHIGDEIISELKLSDGYIYLQAVDGGTGPQEGTCPQVEKNVKLIKNSDISTPIVAGFGISNSEQIREIINMGADGVCVGSSILKAIQSEEGEEYIRSLYEAL